MPDGTARIARAETLESLTIVAHNSHSSANRNLHLPMDVQNSRPTTLELNSASDTALGPPANSLAGALLGHLLFWAGAAIVGLPLTYPDDLFYLGAGINLATG